MIHGVHADRPDDLPAVRQGPDPQGDHRAGGPLQGIGLGQEGAAGDRASSASTASRRRRVVEATRRQGSATDRTRRRDRGPTDAGSTSKRARDDRPSRADARRPRRPKPARRARPTDAMAAADRLDHPGRGGRDPGRRQHPLHARRRSAAGPGPGACRASSSAAGGSSGAARSGRWSPRRGASRPRTSSRSCSRISGLTRGRPMDVAAILARFLDEPRVAGSGPSSTPTAARPAACSPTAWRSRRCSRPSRRRCSCSASAGWLGRRPGGPGSASAMR